MFGIARGDMPGNPFIEAVAGKQAETGGETLFAVEAFLLNRFETAGGNGKLELLFSWSLLPLAGS